MTPSLLTRSPTATPLALALALALLSLCPLAASAGEGQASPTHLALAEEARINEGLPPPPAELDRSTPLSAWSGFLKACQAGRPEVGVHVLNLSEVPTADRPALGRQLAQELCAVLKATNQLSVRGIDDTTIGPIVDGIPTNFSKVALFTSPTGTEELWLRRVLETSSQEHHWLFTRTSISMIQGWYQTLVQKNPSRRAMVETLNPGLGGLPADLVIDSPRATVGHFLKLSADGDYAAAARLIDLTSIDPARQPREGARLARRLNVVLTRLQPAGYPLLSDDRLGAPEQGIPLDEELVARPILEGREIQIRLARFPRAVNSTAWLFSAETASQIDPLYQGLGYGWAGDHLAPVFFQWKLLGIQLWQWIGLLLGLALSLCAGFLLGWLTRRLLRVVARLTRWSWDDQFAATSGGPLAVLFWTAAFAAALEPLALDAAPRGTLLQACKFVAILSVGWLLIRLVDVASQSLARFFNGRRDDLATAMIPVFRKVLKPIIGLLVIVFALQNAGMNVAGLLAGLGIGGLAVALAAKPALENFFGSIAIAFDRPFRIGDYVQVKGLAGTIEEVGLRTTRLRTPDRTLVSIPNGQMSDATVENFSARDRIRLLAELSLEHATTADQLRLILDEVKRYLVAHPMVRQEDFAVRFVGFGPSGLQLQLIAYILVTNSTQFAAIREAILLDVGEIIRRAGSGVALASHTLHIPQPREGLSLEARAASEIVAQRRAAGELCLPEIPAAVREEIEKKRSA